MGKLFSFIAFLVVAGGLAALTGFDNVPPVHRGKILMPDGYEPKILMPGKYFTGVRGKMILIETSTNAKQEPMSIIMKDKLPLQFDVTFRGRIDGSDQVLNSIFDDILPNGNNNITFDNVYRVYGRDIIKNQARKILNSYTVNDVHKNYAKISTQLAEAILPELKNTPLQLSNVTLGNITFPGIITEAVEQAAKKRQDIEKEQANAEIALTKKKNELALAQADYEIKITKAKAVADENKLLAKGITDDLIEIKRLELLEAIINNKDGNTVFLPVEALTSNGAQIKMYNNK